MTTPLLSIRNLSVRYDGAAVLRGIDLDLHRGEVLALVGASGSGKSTLARCVMGLVTPSPESVILLDGQPLAARASRRPAAVRRRLGMVFQDSGTAFNPRYRVGQILAEALVLSGRVARRDIPEHIGRLLADVGLQQDHAKFFAHQLSGGQRQRVGISRALAGEPDVLICDEAVSALDVSVQAQILNLLLDIQERCNLAMLFVTHDLAVVDYLADRTVTLVGGRITGTGDERARSPMDCP